MSKKLNKSATESDSAQFLYDGVLNATRAQQQLFLSELLRQAPASLVSSLQKTMADAGVTAVSRASAWQRLPAIALGCVFDYLSSREMLTLIERTCRCWRASSFDGIGWTQLDVHWRSLRAGTTTPIWLLIRSGRLRNTRVVKSIGHTGYHLSAWLHQLPVREVEDLDGITTSMLECVKELPFLHTLTVGTLYVGDCNKLVDIFNAKASLRSLAVTKLSFLCLPVLAKLTNITTLSLSFRSFEYWYQEKEKAESLTASLPSSITDLTLAICVKPGSLAHLPKLRSLRLPIDAVFKQSWKTEDLDAFFRMPLVAAGKLEHLTASLCFPSDESLKELTRITALEIALRSSAFFESHAQMLSRLRPGVRILEVFLRDFTDKGLAHISKMESLQYVHFCGVAEFTDTGIAQLRANRKLAGLEISGDRDHGITGVTCQALARLEQLTSLRLCWVPQLSLRGILLLASMPKLAKLELQTAAEEDKLVGKKTAAKFYRKRTHELPKCTFAMKRADDYRRWENVTVYDS